MDVEVIQGIQMIIRARGTIDLSNVERFRVPLEDAARESPKGFVIDLSGVTYIDSAGIQAIIGAYKILMNSGGRISLIITDRNVKEILTITGLNQLPGFSICDTLEAAEQALSDE